jgi:hypothetical protein
VNTEGCADSRDTSIEEGQAKARGDRLSRRTYLGVGSASLATAALGAMHLNAQSRSNIQRGGSCAGPASLNQADALAMPFQL